MFIVTAAAILISAEIAAGVVGGPMTLVPCELREGAHRARVIGDAVGVVRSNNLIGRDPVLDPAVKSADHIVLGVLGPPWLFTPLKTLGPGPLPQWYIPGARNSR